MELGPGSGLRLGVEVGTGLELGLGLSGGAHRAELRQDRAAGVEAAHGGLERLVRVRVRVRVEGEGEGEGGGRGRGLGLE